MRVRTVAIIIGFALLMPLVAASAAPVAADDSAGEEVRYRVRAGDTLSLLAARYMLRPEDYRIVQDLNHVARPDRLPKNTDLRIPVALLRVVPARAVIVSFSGEVLVTADGKRARPGMAIGEGARLQTGANSFLTIKGPDGSRVSMPSQSVMRIARMRRVLLTGALEQEFAIDHGRVQTRVMPQTVPGSRYRLRTPIAVSAVRGTEFRVAYGEGPSLTEVLGGTVAVGAPGSAAPASIPPGVGAAVSASGALATEKLLPPPALAAPMAVASEEQVRVALSPVPGAVRYRVQIARDAGFSQVFVDAESDTPALTFGGVGNGKLFARATAFSATGFEGMPAVYSFTRRVHTITATVTQKPVGTLYFTWKGAGGSTRGHFQLFGASGDVPLVDAPNLAHYNARVRNLPPGSYRWRVASPGLPDDPREVWTPFATVQVPGEVPATGK